MLHFYAYHGHWQLGQEPLGSDRKLIFYLKTIRGAKNRCKAAYNGEPYRLYTFTNFYDNSTFRLVL